MAVNLGLPLPGSGPKCPPNQYPIVSTNTGQVTCGNLNTIEMAQFRQQLGTGPGAAFRKVVGYARYLATGDPSCKTIPIGDEAAMIAYQARCGAGVINQGGSGPRTHPGGGNTGGSTHGPTHQPPIPNPGTVPGHQGGSQTPGSGDPTQTPDDAILGSGFGSIGDLLTSLFSQQQPSSGYQGSSEFLIDDSQQFAPPQQSSGGGLGIGTIAIVLAVGVGGYFLYQKYGK